MALPPITTTSKSYSFGNLGSAYGDRLDLAYPDAGYYSATIDVVLGDLYNLQGVPPGSYNWNASYVRPSDPTLLQTLQFLIPNAMPPMIYGRRMIGKNGILATWPPWFLFLQWNGPGNPLTG